MGKGLGKLFGEVTGTYELVNRVLTLGLDRRWRRRAAEYAAEQSGHSWLDVCTGTGEMARGLRSLAPPDSRVVGADICLPMLQEAARQRDADGIRFAAADATALPFRDASFDVVTISFASRNINSSPRHFRRCLAEFRRVLTAGGRLVVVETSQPPNRWVRGLFHLYVKLSVRPVGSLISGSRPAYAYLAHTIPRFHTAGELAAILSGVGFSRVAVHPLTLGAVAVHVATK